jgi:DNA repair exonuclease SbcCD ATPase subunit
MPCRARARPRRTTSPRASTKRRLRQLIDYRERLTALAARPDAKLDELIKVESELSTVQSQIETLASQQHALAERVATERLTIEIYAEAAYDSVAGPIVAAWQDGRAVLGRNASALRFAIGALP